MLLNANVCTHILTVQGRNIFETHFLCIVYTVKDRKTEVSKTIYVWGDNKCIQVLLLFFGVNGMHEAHLHMQSLLK